MGGVAMTARGAKQPYRIQRRRWQAWELEFLRRDPDSSPYKMGMMLRRTSTAIRVMRQKLERGT